MWNKSEEDFWRSPFRKEWLRIHAAWGVVAVVFSLAIAALFVWSMRWRGGEWPVSLALLAFVATFVWANVARLKAGRAIRDLNAVITWKFIAGPRPEDPDELRVWLWQRQFICAWLAMAVGMLLFVIVMLLRGD